MIEKIDRKTVFEQHKNIASEISEMQKAFFDEDDLNSCETEEDKNDYLSAFDARNLKIDSKKKIYNVISIDQTDLKTFSKDLAQNLITLLKELNIETLIIIAHYKMNFFGNLEIKFKPVKNAYEDLKAITGSYLYEEALRVNLTNHKEFSTLINIAFWIERIDASAPEFIFFYDEKDKFAFNICKGGNVHTIEFGKHILTNKVLEKCNWHEIDEKC